MSNQKLNYRQVRWALYLSRFDFVLEHISESKMRKADGLSKRLDWEIGVEKNNEERIAGNKEDKSGRSSHRRSGPVRQSEKV